MTKKGILTLAATAAAVAATAAPASAQQLNPPPPAGYACNATGSGTICHRRMSFDHFAGFDGTCAQGFDILENGHSEERGERVYDRSGDLVKRVLHEEFTKNHPLNVFYNSVSGKTVPYWSMVNETDTFGVPGDFGTMTSRSTGNLYSSVLPGAGLLVKDAGVFTFSPDGDVLERHGPKMLFDGDNAKLCAALA
jgi:hypothetical protein